MTLNQGIELVESKGYKFIKINKDYDSCYYLEFRSPVGKIQLLSQWDIENNNFWIIMNYSNFWDNVLKQEEWNDELKRWENTHPEYKPFKEDSDSQRQQQQELVWIKVSNLQSSSIV